MIVLKYEKCEEARFISHIDLLRHISRILLRAEIPVRRSNGFNPHSLVFFSPPLALGVTSNAEYLTVDTDMRKDEVLARFNASSPKGLRAIAAFESQKNPNLQARVVAADYIYPYAYKDIDLSDVEIEYLKKGELVKENATAKILDSFERDGKLCLRLAAGGVNLRPDRLLPFLEKELAQTASVTDIVKTAQYVLEAGEYVDVDNILS